MEIKGLRKARATRPKVSQLAAYEALSYDDLLLTLRLAQHRLELLLSLDRVGGPHDIERAHLRGLPPEEQKRLRAETLTKLSGLRAEIRRRDAT
jgi:hypothetical protein